jgi:hypothetical protein
MMNVQKMGPAIVVLFAFLLFLTGSCDSAGGSSPAGTECAAAGQTCLDSAQCEAITPGAVCVDGLCTCNP